MKGSLTTLAPALIGALAVISVGAVSGVRGWTGTTYDSADDFLGIDADWLQEVRRTTRIVSDPHGPGVDTYGPSPFLSASEERRYGEVFAEASPSGGPGTSPAVEEPLRAVIRFQGQEVAILGEDAVTEGRDGGGYRVLSIDDHRVLVRGGAGEAWLRLAEAGRVTVKEEK